MIAKRMSILLGLAMATVVVALLAPVLGATARGGGSGGGTHGSLPTGVNQNPNAGSGGSGSGGNNGSIPKGPNQNPNAGNSSSGGSGGHLLPPGVHVPPGSGSGSGHGGPNGGPGHPGQ
jgi:hypothetical protein